MQISSPSSGIFTTILANNPNAKPKQNLLRHTPDTFPDYKNLKLASEQIETIVQFLDAKKRMSENSVKLIHLQTALVFPAGRVLL